MILKVSDFQANTNKQSSHPASHLPVLYQPWEKAKRLARVLSNGGGADTVPIPLLQVLSFQCRVSDLHALSDPSCPLRFLRNQAACSQVEVPSPRLVMEVRASCQVLRDSSLAQPCGVLFLHCVRVTNHSSLLSSPPHFQVPSFFL